MDYPFENLDAEQFQHVCQALLVKEFPSARLLPVGQPDGGRDAFLAHWTSHRRERKELVVFQVKFARQPNALDDPREWALEAIEGEADKVQALAEQGAVHYRFITNIKGSAHFGTGSVDRADSALDGLAIPADAWWRDDLNRRLDSAWDIKWAYPELFKGTDFVRALFEAGLSDDRERRSSAIRAFLAEHYEQDAQVKFKQVELQNDLLDLFVDVPARLAPPQGARERTMARQIFNLVAHEANAEEDNDTGEETFYVERGPVSDAGRWVLREPRLEVGAATLLLDRRVQEELPLIVLEGAPGQGKSTLVQYVCQVHRMRLLDRADSLASIAEHHREGPVRLPFRVDLRDLSLWLQGGNPFAEQLEEHLGGTRSLEGLLARQVTTGSGGASFEVEDLHAVAKLSSLLIILDGLDEVADIEERTRVVREVTSAVTRLRSIAASVQVVVTSRPAAFANSPAFPTERFQYCHLQSITQPLVMQYAERWIAARGLEPALADDVREVLAEKLEEPHMRELARNPMQLAILLSLIHRRGPSLPDKRTALYDSYVHLFFDREAEKTDHVREHRDLLVDIHQYLGWRLQAEAETGKSLGSISGDRLREILVRYLKHEEREPELVDSIFHGLVERVVAIVSRVEGTYEFEVQPLREYFAARYLYDTAPYSPPGAEKAGDKTDRFDALARNFYWLNVTRFYAGCYSKGELPSLVDRLEFLAESEGFQETTHPRYLATMLLSDWVFAQQPRSMKSVVDLALEDLGVRRAASGVGEPLTLPTKSGRDELVESCWQLLSTDPRPDRAVEVASTLRANSGDAELDARFLDAIQSTKGKRRTKFFSHGEWTGSLSRLSSDALGSLLAEQGRDRARLSSLMHAGRFEVLEATETVSTYVADELLAGRLRAPLTAGPPGSPLEALGQALRIPLAMVDLDYGAARRWLGAWQELSVPRTDRTASADLVGKCWETAAVLTDQLSRPPTDWTTSLAPWRHFVGASRDLWGDRRIHLEFATASAGIRSRKERGAVGSDLFDPAHSLCDRARYARLLAGNSRWWGRQLEAAPRKEEALFVASLFFAWASAGTLASQLHIFNEWLAHASGAEAETVFWSVVAGSRMNRSLEGKPLALDDSALPDVLHPRTVVTLARRAGTSVEGALYSKYLGRYEGSDPRVLTFCSRVAWRLVNQGSMPWPNALEVIRRAYANGAAVTPLRPGYRTGRAQVALPDDIARTVVKQPRDYPLEIVAVAESRCRELMNDAIVPVEATAREQEWSWE